MRESGIDKFTSAPQSAAKVPFYESITQASHPESGSRIRVWRREEFLPMFTDSEILEAIASIPVTADMETVLGVIGSISRVTAIELVDANGNGIVKYLEW